MLSHAAAAAAAHTGATPPRLRPTDDTTHCPQIECAVVQSFNTKKSGRTQPLNTNFGVTRLSEHSDASEPSVAVISFRMTTREVSGDKEKKRSAFFFLGHRLLANRCADLEWDPHAAL